MLKFIALTFDYNIENLSSIGRKWAPNVYKGKDFIFEYSAASYASFISHNPDQQFEIYTDDCFLIKEKLQKYKISLDNTKIINWKDELEIYKRHEYSFEPVVQLVKKYKDTNEYIVKLDNDLICLKKFQIENEEHVCMWKYERKVFQGNPLWGERHVCQTVLNTEDFNIYNMGVMGIPVSFWKYYEEYEDIYRKMIKVDISKITDVDSKIYHCCEQTAYNWIFHKYNYTILEKNNIFDHHFEKKIKCIDDAKWLLK